MSNKDGGYKKRNNRGKPKRPRYWQVGSIVYLNVVTANKGKEVHLCEARIVRQPLFHNGPYKVVVTGVRLLRGGGNKLNAMRLLGLKLRRGVDSLLRTRNAFSMYSNEEWMHMTEKESDEALKRAIAFINKDKLDQAKSKNGWLLSRKKRN